LENKTSTHELVEDISYVNHKTLYENQLKMDERRNVRHETLKLLEKNIGQILKDMGFLIGLQSSENKSKNWQMRLHQTNTFCAAKETITRVKRQLT
jgi:ribosomal protein S8